MARGPKPAALSLTEGERALMYMADRWRMPVERMTLYYSYLAITSLIASLFCTGPLLRALTPKVAAVGSAMLGGLLMMTIVLPTSPFSLWLTAGPTSLVITLTLSACAALLSNAVSAERQGQVMGNNQALQVGAEAIGAALAGRLPRFWWLCRWWSMAPCSSSGRLCWCRSGLLS